MVPMTGRAIGQGVGRGLEGLTWSGIGGEIIYSFVIIFCSLAIYFGTRELYNLSSHRGIKYFRQAFLFFALAYFFRSFIKIVLFYFKVNEIVAFLPIFGRITLFAFMYFSSMAIFYLLYSVMWKKWKSKSAIYIFHLIALLISVIVPVFRNHTLYFIINIFLFLLISLTAYLSHKQSRKKSQNLYIIYFMLLIFWILNIVDILVPNFLMLFQLFIYIMSIATFLLIFYKVIKKTG